MEYILGIISKLFDSNITNINSINHKSNICKNYMRCIVLSGDFLQIIV